MAFKGDKTRTVKKEDIGKEVFCDEYVVYLKESSMRTSAAASSLRKESEQLRDVYLRLGARVCELLGICLGARHINQALATSIQHILGEFEGGLGEEQREWMARGYQLTLDSVAECFQGMTEEEERQANEASETATRNEETTDGQEEENP